MIRGPQGSEISEVAAALIDAVGTPGFVPKLNAALSRVAFFDLSAATAYPYAQRPILLYDGLGGISSPEVMRNYLDGTYLLDPAYTACVQQVPSGFYRMSELAPDAFFEGEYFNSSFVHPCISMESGSLAEEALFFARLPSGFYATHSIMRSHGRGPYPLRELAALRALAPAVVAAMRRHWRNLTAAYAGGPADAIEPVLVRFLPGLLSPRERSVVELVLRGHSSASIGVRLGISEGTVKNHRKHIHAKLGISGQAELFALFVRHVLGAESAAREMTSAEVSW